MLDKTISLLYKRWINGFATFLASKSVSANYVTMAGFLLGISAVPAIISGQYFLALMFILLNRLCDGLDGLLAVKTKITALGGFIDITFDFIFYSSIPVAFGLLDPNKNALPALILVYSFLTTGTSFLASAVVAEKYKIENNFYVNKSFYYSIGLIEATETTIFYIIICLFPNVFPIAAYVFGSLCFITTFIRILNMIILYKKFNI